MKTKLSIFCLLMALLPLIFTVQSSYAQQAGSLRVSLGPAEAVTAGVRWRVDSGSWRNSGATVSNLPAGQHLVEFQEAAGWVAPRAAYVTVASGQTASQSFNFVRNVVSITGILYPEEVRNAGMQWRPNASSPWRNSGETVENLPPGQYFSIDTKQIAGWERITPFNPQTLSAGQTGSFSVEFRRTTAAIRVDLDPLTARNAGARWRVAGGSWRQSGEEIQNLAEGTTLNIEFNTVPGFVQPLSQQRTISREDRGQLLRIRGMFELQPGTLQVTIQPAEAVRAGAQWGMVSGQGPVWINDPRGGPNKIPVSPQQAWHNSGESLTLPVGQKSLTFKTIPGWEPESGGNTVEIRSGQTTLFSKTYRPGPGNLAVTIEPARAREAGAQWQVDGGAWANSGSEIGRLMPGRHRVAFKETPGWIRPEGMEVNISPDQTARVAGTYTETGSLSVTITPPEAVSKGGQWGVSLGGGNESAWQDSGATVSNIRPGPQRLRFKSLNDSRWTTPEAITVTVVSGQIARASAVYQQNPGSLSAVVLPAEASNAGGRWRIPNIGGGAWQNSGAYMDVPAGQYNVEFKPVDGWVAPAAQNVKVNSLQRIQVSGEYRRERGSLQVTLQPEGAVRSGARWRIAGQDWRNSGETVSGLMPGPRQIEFHTAGEDWETPPGQTVHIVVNQTASATAAYRGISGMLNVTIEPSEAVQSGAQWRVGNRAWKRSGESDRLPIGPQQIALNIPSGWAASAPPPVNVVAGQVTRVTAPFQRGAGSLLITLQPAGAVSAGAQWRVDGGAWQNSGSTLPNVNAGSRSIEYKEIPGWIRPASETATINAGQTAALVKNYTPQPGSLQVTIIGSGGDFAGRWQVDNMGWKTSNVIQANVSPGQKRIEFNDVPGWTKPAPIDVSITSGQLQRVSATYTRSTGLLRVIIQPGNVESAGARWRIDGGPWQPSRQPLDNIAVGAHQVEYSDVAGWVKPPPTPVNIIGGQSTQITGTYQRR